VTVRHNSENVVLNLLVKKVLLVSGRELSRHLLTAPPCSQGYVEGALKRNSMSFLAPHALTITHDDQWHRLRPFNETVLRTGEADPDQGAFLHQVRRAFSGPVGDLQEIRRSMGRAMLGIVFGDGSAPESLSEEIQALFGLVQNPVKRTLAGPAGRARRQAFDRRLRELWRQTRESGQPSLLARAHRLEDRGSEEELLQQVPHWMFTFTGSGTDLLFRTLALVGSRPPVRARALAELRGAGSLDQPTAIARLKYLEACLLEAGRLFPPVTLTFHRAPGGDVFGNTHIPPGIEIVHYFPQMQRAGASDPEAHCFRPDRWLDSAEWAWSTYPYLFLGGARACPGKELILFVCKSALAVLLEQRRVTAASRALSEDPLPYGFPMKSVRLQVEA
jgi:cytochrome P450